MAQGGGEQLKKQLVEKGVALDQAEACSKLFSTVQEVTTRPHWTPQLAWHGVMGLHDKQLECTHLMQRHITCTEKGFPIRIKDLYGMWIWCI